MNPVDGLLSEASVLVVAGPGGVGKTTLSAALACRAAARLERRVLLITVDPARRLADALGQGLTAEPVLVPVGGPEGRTGRGRLWAVMVDMAQSWDALVTRCAPEPEDAAAVLANPLYRTLTTRFVQSHDYVALDQLCEVADGDRYDLVVVDTPPSSHALDLLDAPERMASFFDGFLLRWLTAPYRSRAASLTARPFLAVAQRLLGGPFLARVGELFWLFSRLQPGLVARAELVRDRLADPNTRYVMVTTGEPLALSQTAELARALIERDSPPEVLIQNRAPLPLDPETADRLVDPSLRAAVGAITGPGSDLDQWAAEHELEVPHVLVHWRAEPLTSVADLVDLLDHLPPLASGG